MPAPEIQDVFTYVNGVDEIETFSSEDVESAYAAEKAAQRSVCKVPADDAEWPADLAEALMRRVAHNLAVRNNPMGIETASSEFGATAIRVGGRDSEVRRLEAPHRKRVVG